MIVAIAHSIKVVILDSFVNELQKENKQWQTNAEA
jgi:hypothetical protein